jgi:hypothetical protein
VGKEFIRSSHLMYLLLAIIVGVFVPIERKGAYAVSAVLVFKLPLPLMAIIESLRCTYITD